MSSTKPSFDFVVVGAGTAGCILAHRLAVSPSQPSVLLLEVGGHADDEQHRPPFQRYLNAFTRPDLNHGYITTPQMSAGGASMPYVRGKGIGGSSLLNFMVYLRGASSDFDRWAELVGSNDWAWDSVLKSFRKVERFVTNVPEGFEKWANPNLESYGTDGFVGVSLPANWEKETVPNFEAFEELGYPINLDLNTGNPIGYGLGPVSMEAGQRSTSGSSLFSTAIPSNLTIWTETRAIKINFDGKKAVGVTLQDGRTVFASKEIILTAGAIDTPKLLLLSGVGPSAELSKHNIKQVHELSGVGKNVQDHVVCFLSDAGSPDFSDRVPFLLSPTKQAEAIKIWTESKNGPLTQVFASLSIAFVKEVGWEDSAEFRDLPLDVQQYIQKPDVPHVEYLMNAPLIAPKYTLSDPDISFAGSASIVMNPQSRGSITLASANPDDAPLIDLALLSHPYDKYAMINGVRGNMKFSRTKALSKFVTGHISEPKSDSDEDIWQFITENVGPVFHANGSVMMGKIGGEDACVDKDLKVFGLESLRVADLSVCPLTPNNHTQSTAYLIGQIASEKIIQQYSF